MAIQRVVKNSSEQFIGSDKSIDLEGLGDITIGTSEVEIVVGEVSEEFRIQADSGNTGIIYIGKTGVQNDGSNDFIRLEAGEETTFEYNDYINALYAISDVAAQTINVGVLVNV